VNAGINKAKTMGFNTMLDSYHFFDKLGGLIKVPPTNTNVNDVIVILIE